MPADTDPSELIVGFLDAERASGVEWTAADLNDKIALHVAQHGPFVVGPAITEEQLARIRERRRELFARWDAVPEGDTLELTFDVTRDA